VDRGCAHVSGGLLGSRAVMELALLGFPDLCPGPDQAFLPRLQEGRVGGGLRHSFRQLAPSRHVIGKRCVVHDSLLSWDQAGSLPVWSVYGEED
jgi:hypothetical protein